MSDFIKQHAFLEKFSCIGKDCPDTCCHEWEVKVGTKHRALYAKEAPELLDALDIIHCMKHDAHGRCIKLEDGLCNIQNKYGTDFLSDSCHFYPRIMHKIDDDIL